MTLSETKARFLEEFYADEDPGEHISYRLLIGGEPATEYVEEISFGPSEEDGPAHILEVTLVGFEPEIKEQDNVSVDLYFGDLANRLEHRDFQGKVYSVSGEWVVKVVAATGGRWQSETKLLTDKEYSGYWPSTAMHDALSYLRDYYAAFNIPPLRKPQFNHRLKTESDDRFNALDGVDTILMAIEEESGLTQLDAELNVADGYLENPLSEPGEPVRALVVGTDIERPFEPAPNVEGRYSEVIVYERDQDGKMIVLARAPITYHDPQIRAPLAAPLMIESTDETATKASIATERAYKEAARHSYGEWKASFTVLSLDPRIRRTATVQIQNTDPATGVYTEWTALIRTHKRDPESQTTEVSAILTRRKRPAKPGEPEPVLGISPTPSTLTEFGGHFSTEPDKTQQGTIDNFAAFASALGKTPGVLADWMTVETYTNNITALRNYYNIDLISTAVSLGTGLAVTLTFYPGANGSAGYETVIQGNEIKSGDGLNFDEWAIIVNYRAREFTAASGKDFYFRFLHEPNNRNHEWCVIKSDGTRRSHTTRHIVDLYRRMMIIVRGGTVADINAKLSAAGQPDLFARSATLSGTGFPELANTGAIANASRLKHHWAGLSPKSNSDMTADAGINEFWRYYPGSEYVDSVGIDLYWADGNQKWLSEVIAFARREGKTVVLPECGLLPWWGDDPARMRQVTRFIENHPDITFMANFEVNKQNATTPDAYDWRLHPTRPNSFAVWRSMCENSRFRQRDYS